MLVILQLHEKHSWNDTRAAIGRFEDKYMDAKPDKFQSIILNKEGSVSISLSIHDDFGISIDHSRMSGITLDDS